MARDREGRVILGLLGFMVALASGALVYGFKEESAKAATESALSSTFNNAVFQLEGAHAVTADYEGRKYTYNFDNKTILGGQTRGAGFGGAGYGGMVSFEDFEDKAAIETARTQGCTIAAHMAKAANPGFPVAAAFEDARAKAVRFTAGYCP